MDMIWRVTSSFFSGIGTMVVVSGLLFGRIVSAPEMPWPFWLLAVFTAALVATATPSPHKED